MIGFFSANLKSLYARRELILTLVGKELKARYRGSFFGVLWTFLNPLLLLLVYALVFSVYMRVQVENYAVFMFVGLLPWIWFSTSLLDGVNSIVSAGSLITKSMFPAEILPMVKILSNLMNYVFSLPLLFIFMAIYGVPVKWTILWLPVIMIAQLLFTVGLVYLLSSVNVRFRDTQHILGNFVTFWFFLCPILYPISQTPQEWRFVFYLNPMALLSVCYQDIFINGNAPDPLFFAIPALTGAVITLIGFYQFDRYKETFAEEI
ncbi:MAG: ABC transporter permease [Nitrospinae bacterium]|nr:ABC transporter permease [Nitrospinota bacterium]